jgi:hypothetical protein
MEDSLFKSSKRTIKIKSKFYPYIFNYKNARSKLFPIHKKGPTLELKFPTFETIK